MEDQTGAQPSYNVAEWEALLQDIPATTPVMIRDHRGVLRPAEAVLVTGEYGVKVLVIREIRP